MNKARWGTDGNVGCRILSAFLWCFWNFRKYFLWKIYLSSKMSLQGTIVHGKLRSEFCPWEVKIKTLNLRVWNFSEFCPIIRVGQVHSKPTFCIFFRRVWLYFPDGNMKGIFVCFYISKVVIKDQLNIQYVDDL